MVLLSRLIAALAYAGAALLFGVALGERGELGIVQKLFAWVIPAATFVLTVFTRTPGRPYVLLTGAAMFGGVLLGQSQFARAWEECLTRGYEVRDALVRHDARHDGYPARLEELEIALPCRCGFRNDPAVPLERARVQAVDDERPRGGDVRPPVTAVSSSGRSSAPPRIRPPSTPSG